MSMLDSQEAFEVSVVIPVFADPEGLGRCLDALDRQTCREFEVVVVDNGSPQPLAAPSGRSFPIRLVVCATPGSYAARNAGVAVAQGAVLAFTDADCVPEDQWLASGLAALRRAGGEVVVGGEVQYVMPEQRTGTALYQVFAGFRQGEIVAARKFAATANLFCTRAVFDQVGRFDERVFSGGDSEWCWRAAYRGYQTVFAPEAVVRTLPRQRLGAAVRQARRVAAGRARLAALQLPWVGAVGLQSIRSPLQGLR